MADALIHILRDISTRGLATLAVVLVAVWIGKLIFDLFTRYKIDEEVTGKNNAAVGIALTGYYIGLAVAIAGVLSGPGSDTLGRDLLMIGLYSVVAIVLLNISAFINDKLILYSFNNNKELVDDRNAGTGSTMAGSYLATGLIINAVVSGEASGAWWQDLLPCLIYFVLGQVVLIIAGLWYQFITKYDIHQVIREDDNVAAGIGFGGFMFAVGYIVRAAMMGGSISWAVDIVSFALYVVIVFILLAVGQFVTDKIFLPKAKISDEIGVQGNVAAALISSAIYITMAILIAKSI
ncbi:DUF350 domain-containing protein [Candidatus Poribacteria bacterium]|nr:DUF350 domain-containing protein [Candidatus Poribacteria bacterium]